MTVERTNTGAIPMAMSMTEQFGYGDFYGSYTSGKYYSEYMERQARTKAMDAHKAKQSIRRDHRIVRIYLAEDATYPQRVIKELLTKEEARAHCIGLEGSSMTATKKSAKRRTRELGHWFDTFEQYR